jgi:hypothetical protein
VTLKDECNLKAKKIKLKLEAKTLNLTTGIKNECNLKAKKNKRCEW